jgi:hypothetical protein
MRKFFAVAVGSAVALVGFAGAANAAATIDLIWADSGTSMIGDPDTSIEVTATQSIQLQVIMTAVGSDYLGGAVSVDYSEVLGKLSVLGYSNTPGGSSLPVTLGDAIDTGSRVEGINSFAALFFGLGTGLLAGQSHQLGTVTFLKSAGALNGTFEIRSDANGVTDGVVNLDGSDGNAGTTFNSAFLINVPEPGALSLLVLGLGGLGLMGRGRRS